jgi:hypothetical protein
MELLDRYLQAVTWLLPKTQKQDILSELSDDLRSEIEEREGELGRKLEDREVEAILQRWGHPMTVAARYLPQHSLIGPVWFPVYSFVLKMVSLVYLLPWLLVWLFCAVFLPSYRAAHPGLGLIGTLGSFVEIVVYAFASITLVFALLERSKALEGWSPRKLPAERDPNRTSRFESFGEMLGSLIFTLWWVGTLHLPTVPGLPITPAPIWSRLYWPVLLVMLASIAVSAFGTFQPRWTRLRAGLRLAVDSAELALVGILLASGPWFAVALPGEHSADAPRISTWLNLSIGITLGAIGIACLFGILRGVRRVRPPKAPLIAAMST